MMPDPGGPVELHLRRGAADNLVVFIVEAIVELALRKLFNYGGSDETPVFVYLLVFQLVAIVGIVMMCGWSAFSRPW
jgi:hypothetical protein